MVHRLTFEFQPVTFSDTETLPRKAGVFRIFDINGNLILLDKTHNLSKKLERFYRVESHRRGLDLGRITDRVDFCKTDSPFETLYLLHHQRREWFPETYLQMRTFRRFHVLKINRRQRFPRLYATQQLKSGVDYFGPFETRQELDRMRATLERTFKIRPCTYNIRGNDPYPHCLYYQTHGCSRPCNSDITRDSYLTDIDAAIAFIRGSESSVTESVFSRMQALASATRFEEAEELRQLLERIERAREESSKSYFDLSTFDFVALMDAGSVRNRKIAVVRGGHILGFEEHSVDDIGNTAFTTIKDSENEPERSADPELRYAGFCLVSAFLIKPVKSVRFVPIGEPEQTARHIAEGIPSRRPEA